MTTKKITQADRRHAERAFKRASESKRKLNRVEQNLAAADGTRNSEAYWDGAKTEAQRRKTYLEDREASIKADEQAGKKPRIKRR